MSSSTSTVSASDETATQVTIRQVLVFAKHDLDDLFTGRQSKRFHVVSLKYIVDPGDDDSDVRSGVNQGLQSLKKPYRLSIVTCSVERLRGERIVFVNAQRA